MSEIETPPSTDAPLDSRKAIAAYLNRDVQDGDAVGKVGELAGSSPPAPRAEQRLRVPA
ncbi:hypothetical protein BH18ACI5_BH18ACI5_25580 [soil metagenome]